MFIIVFTLTQITWLLYCLWTIIAGSLFLTVVCIFECNLYFAYYLVCFNSISRRRGYIKETEYIFAYRWKFLKEISNCVTRFLSDLFLCILFSIFIYKSIHHIQDCTKQSRYCSDYRYLITKNSFYNVLFQIVYLDIFFHFVKR